MSWKHPELEKDETFLVNVRNEKEFETLKTQFPLFIKSFRLGKEAYNYNGKQKFPHMKPVFIIKNK